jgi:hypothetical protein
VDFCFTKVIPQHFAVAKSCFDLSSDYSSVRNDFRHLINQRLTLNVSLKTEEDIEAAVKYNGQVGMQRQNIQRHSRHTTALY